MERIERTEIFGRHVISAIVRSVPAAGANEVWEVDVAAVALGYGTDTPLMRFASPERIAENPIAALDAAVQAARRRLIAEEPH
jgi:hypothetical protein